MCASPTRVECLAGDCLSALARKFVRRNVAGAWTVSRMRAHRSAGSAVVRVPEGVRKLSQSVPRLMADGCGLGLFQMVNWVQLAASGGLCSR